MTHEDVTGKLCEKCRELIEDCTCDEEPRVQEWEDHPFQPERKSDGQPQPD